MFLNRLLGHLGFFLMGVHAYALTEEVSLHVRNSTNEKWYIANYSTKENGKYEPRGGIVVAPRDLRTWKIAFHNLPEKWPNNTQKTLIGHLELSKSLEKKHQVYNTADIFIISGAGKQSAWTCETFNQSLGCRITTQKDKKTLDLVIGRH